MHDLKWSASEKKLARTVFDAALMRELATMLCEFKTRAAKATTPQEMWEIQDYLVEQRSDVDSKYDFRYSQLIIVFGRLLRENLIGESELQGLSPDKLSYIRQIASL